MNANEPAFPHPADQYSQPFPGLTKLEAFTMAAMQGLLVNVRKGSDIHNVAKDALDCARATLATLEAEKKGTP